MLHRRTQTAEYWAEHFQLEDSDIEHLYSVLLEAEMPLSVDEMALALVRYRVQMEDDELARKAKPKEVYRPSETYEIGHEIAFPQFDQAVGRVVGMRPGANPDAGDFGVIHVEFEDGSDREFASGLSTGHLLDDLEESIEEEDDLLLPPEELFIEYGGAVVDELEARLDEHDDLVRLAGRWFPRSLLVDVNIGHLNLAEAVLDMAGGGPMTTHEILGQIGMLSDSNSRLAEFSMNYALQEDARFDEVGPAGQVLWYLVRMEPEEVRTPPERLAYEPIAYDPELLPPELRELELEIGDEHSDIPVPRRSVPQSVTVTLTYPHWRAGTLPLSPQLRRMFPTAYEAPRIRFTLFDPESDQEMPAWVVRPGGYVYGLSGWFEEHQIPVGAYLTVERTNTPGVVKITFTDRNPRKEWVRTAVVEDERLRFDNRQIVIGCEYDDLTIIAVESLEAIDDLWKLVARREMSLRQITLNAGSALASFNPQGNFHAKTLYSAVNLVRRCPPGPVFSELVGAAQFEHVGGPYWRLAGGSPEA